MSYKIYLHLLLICGIWSQGIINAVADEEIGESSDIPVRQKRVINRIPGQDETVSMNDVPYIVRIRENRRINCVGNILSHRIVITTSSCVLFELHQYEVISASIRLGLGNVHNVIDIKKRYGNHPFRHTDGIALLTVNPPFEFGSTCNRIQLHSGLLLPGTLGTISGWGYNIIGADRGTSHPKSLRLIEVPIMTHQECENIYRSYFVISDKDICTFHPQKHCGHFDGGAPLVVDGYLAGVHLWTGPGRNQCNPQYPDVFAVLQHSEYIHWIRSNI